MRKEIELTHAKAAQDIAEARASFEPLLRNQAWLTSVVRIAHLGAWDWDLVKNTQSWSDEQFRIFGLEPSAVEPSDDRFLQALHPEDRERITEMIQQALAKEPRFQIDCRIIWPNGEVRHAVCQGEVCRDEAGHPVRIIDTVLDITERRRAEEEVRNLNLELERRVVQRTAQLEAANKELEAFSYSVSHDLRGPLRAINGFAQILMDEHKQELSPAAQHCLDRVWQGGVHMGHLVDDLLAFSRLGRQNLNKRLVRIDDVVRLAMEDLRADRERRQIELVVGSLPSCETDPALLRQVFVNLLSNAIKFTRPRETARIEIGTLSSEERKRFSDIRPVSCPSEIFNTGVPIFYVRDNGVGFDMRYADKLFGVFQRLHKQRDFEGTGVGLATVQRIIQRHGGQVWAEAELNKGACFYFTLGTPADQTKPVCAAAVGAVL